MTRLFALVSLVLVSLLTVACDDSSSLPTSPTLAGSGAGSSSSGPTAAADLLSGSWSLASIQPAGQAVQPTPAGTIYTLAFADQRLTTRVDCNTCGGPFTLSDQTLTAGPNLACTLAACLTQAFGNTYTSVLAGESHVTVSGNSLELTSARGVLRFSR